MRTLANTREVSEAEIDPSRKPNFSSSMVTGHDCRAFRHRWTTPERTRVLESPDTDSLAPPT